MGFKIKKEVTKKQAQRFAQALMMVNFQTYYPTTKIVLLEMGSAFGCIKDILFSINNVEYKWSNMNNRIEIL